MAEPGSTPHTLLTLCSEAWAQWSRPRAGSTRRAFAQTGESSQRRQTDRALSFCCGWSSGRDALGCSADKHKAWEVSGVCAIALAWASLGLSLGGPETLSLPRNSAFSPRVGIPASLDCPHGHNGAHSQDPGKHILWRKDRFLLDTRALSATVYIRAQMGAKNSIHGPSVCLPWRSLPHRTIPCKGSEKPEQRASKGLSGVGKSPSLLPTSPDLKPLCSDPLPQLLDQHALPHWTGSTEN